MVFTQLQTLENEFKAFGRMQRRGGRLPLSCGWHQLVFALLVGLGTIVFPFFVMQPAMGAGIMASNRPDPTFAQLKSVMTHLSFGVGLYVAAWLQAKLLPQARLELRDVTG